MFIQLPGKLRGEVAALGIKVGTTEGGLGSDQVSVDIRTLDPALLESFYNLLKAYPEARSARVQINAYKRGKENPTGAKVETLRALAGAIMDYIVKDATEGWLFRIQENPVPALVTSVMFYPAIKKKDFERDAYIELQMIQNNRGTTKRLSVSIEGKNNRNATVEEALRSVGWQKETEELHEIYDEELVRYREILPTFGQQLVLRASKNYIPGVDPDGYIPHYKRREMEKNKVDLQKDNGGRLVNDEEPRENNFSVSQYRFDDPDNPYIQDALTAHIEQTLGKETKAFSRAPFHMLLKCYHLGQHTDIELHVRDVAMYEYDKTMRAKLILPEMYSEVLDVLTDDMSLVQEDMVSGKTGGNVILCAGPPGTGKTLTAEVYSEFREVALLKVHSGQLGTSPESIESKLTHFYKKAARWGIPTLIDEFDVFGRARGSNLIQNAVVAVFLRTLEYTNNTIFLTTNRADDMDDAILSRCAAIIKYEYPKEDDLLKIWKSQRDQFLPALTDEVIDEMMATFKTEGKQMAGRDVKNIMRLADRYARAGHELNYQRMMTVAAFRGV